MKNLDGDMSDDEFEATMGPSARVFMNAARKAISELVQQFVVFLYAAESDIVTGASTGRLVVVRDAGREFRTAYMHLTMAFDQEAAPQELRERYASMVGAVETALREVVDNAVEGRHPLAASEYRTLRAIGNRALAARESMFRERGKRRRADLN